MASPLPICSICNSADPTLFSPRGSKSICKLCKSKTIENEALHHDLNDLTFTWDTIQCANCHIFKDPNHDFYARSNLLTSKRPICKLCSLASSKERHKLNYKADILNAAKRRAKEKNIEFSLSDIHIPEFCPVLNLKLIIGGGKPNLPLSPSIDRIDNSQGYTPQNSMVISYRANSLKSDASIHELELILQYMRRFSPPPNSK